MEAPELRIGYYNQRRSLSTAGFNKLETSKSSTGRNPGCDKITRASDEEVFVGFVDAKHQQTPRGHTKRSKRSS
jgi:hypothetical protein